MLEGIADLVATILDLSLFGSSSKKKRYYKIDRIVKDWANKVGLRAQYEYKDEKVRSLNVVDNSGNIYQIWIETLKWGRLKVSATNNKNGRKSRNWNKKCKISNLITVLFEAYGVTEKWIADSGNSRTIK